MCVSADKIECLGRKPDWYFERRECLLNSYTLDETLPFQKLYLLLAQNRDITEVPLLCTTLHRFYTAHALGPPSS